MYTNQNNTNKEGTKMVNNRTEKVEERYFRSLLNDLDVLADYMIHEEKFWHDVRELYTGKPEKRYVQDLCVQNGKITLTPPMREDIRPSYSIDTIIIFTFTHEQNGIGDIKNALTNAIEICKQRLRLYFPPEEM